LDPDRLVILALGEGGQDAAESDHLAGCAGCRTEMEAFQHVAALSAETQGLHDLPPPPDRVWQSIAAEVAQARPTQARPSPAEAVPARPSAATPPGVRRPTVTRSSRPRPRWLSPVLAAAAAAVLAIAGTATVIRLTDRPTTVAVTAQAALAPLPNAPANARGDARVLAGDQLHLHASDLPLTTGFYEVWLIDPDDVTKMISVGTLNAAADVTLPIAPTVDLNRYRLVDVSAEANDGDSAHSGKSLLRGTLTN
jgi:anti-sigma-K factor RskA